MAQDGTQRRIDRLEAIVAEMASETRRGFDQCHALFEVNEKRLLAMAAHTDKYIQDLSANVQDLRSDTNRRIEHLEAVVEKTSVTVHELSAETDRRLQASSDAADRRIEALVSAIGDLSPPPSREVGRLF